jgi:lysophospholipase
MSQLRNDAVDNLMGALTIAGHFIIPGTAPPEIRYMPSDCLNTMIECSLYFNHTLYRGNRVSKMSSYDLSAFSSPNFPPLVDGDTVNYVDYCSVLMNPLIVGIDIVVNWNDVLRQTSLRRFRAHKSNF